MGAPPTIRLPTIQHDGCPMADIEGNETGEQKKSRHHDIPPAFIIADVSGGFLVEVPKRPRDYPKSALPESARRYNTRFGVCQPDSRLGSPGYKPLAKLHKFVLGQARDIVANPFVSTPTGSCCKSDILHQTCVLNQNGSVSCIERYIIIVIQTVYLLYISHN